MVVITTPPDPALPMRVIPIVACALCAIVALGLAFTTFMDVSMGGFPDGHVTDYEKAVDTPLTILAWVEASFGVLFLILACTPIGSRVRSIGLLVALIGILAVLLLRPDGSERHGNILLSHATSFVASFVLQNSWSFRGRLLSCKRRVSIRQAGGCASIRR